MTFEIPVDNPRQVFKMMAGQELRVVNGNLDVGPVANLRMENGKLLGDCEVVDTQLFEHYGSKGKVAGFEIKVIA